MMNDSSAPRVQRRVGGQGFTVFAVAGIAALVALGTWQLDRLHWKEALIAERKLAYALPPLQLSAERDDPDAVAWRRVMLTGNFLHDKEMLVGPRAFRGSPGWHVITPLRVPGGRIVLVDRGWVPADRKDPARRAGSQHVDLVTVEGVVRRSVPPGRFAPRNEPAKEQWFRVDPAGMAAHLGLSGVAPWWVAAVSVPNRDGYPVGTAGLTLPANNHLQYVITWYALAMTLGVIALIRRRQARQTDRA